MLKMIVKIVCFSIAIFAGTELLRQLYLSSARKNSLDKIVI